MSTGPEGRIDIRVGRHGDRVASVEIRSSRPQLAQRLMAGRGPGEAAELAGRVFTLCGRAQRIAAEAACEAAAGMTVPADLAARGGKVLAEMAQEHVWRLLLDWPRQAGQDADMESLLAIRQAAADPERLADVLDTLLRERILGEPATVWRARNLAGFDAWRRSGGTATARLFGMLDEGADPGAGTGALLPTLDMLAAGDLAGLGRLALAEPAFCARPTWREAPAETGALTRQAHRAPLSAWIGERGRGAGARLLARLQELAGLPARLREGGATVVRALGLGENAGMAGVETSRGLLLHVVRLDGGRVADYRIVAPTEWNFHPAGPLFEAVSRLPAEDDLEARARRVALALDPCVEYGLEIVDA